MAAKGGFHAVEIDAGAPNLDLPVLAADPLQQPVGPLAHEISRPEQSTGGRAVAFNAAGGATSIDPMSQRHVWASDDELSDLTRRRVASMLVDQRQAVAWERIADGNSRVVSPAGHIDEPLHHRRFSGGINQLDCRLRREPAAQQIDVAPQRGVSTDPNQSKGIARPLTTVRDHRPQQSRKREQDGDGLCADDIHNLARAGALRIEEVNAGAREQRGHGVSHADDGAKRGQGQKPVLGD